MQILFINHIALCLQNIYEFIYVVSIVNMNYIRDIYLLFYIMYSCVLGST